MNAPNGGKRAAAALADFITLNEEIAAVARARLPLESHLSRLGKELPGKAGPLAARIGTRIERGEALLDAMDAECADLPAAYRATIAAGIESDQLGAALESLVASATRQSELRRVTGVAILYPLVIVVVACQLLAFVLQRIVPAFQWAHRERWSVVSLLAELPYLAPLLAAALPGVIVLAAILWWWQSGRLGSGRTSGCGPLSWLPVARGVRRWSEAATFTELLQMLVERGVPLERALRLSAGAVDSRPLQVAAQRFADQTAEGRAGQPLLDADGKIAADDSFPLLIRLALYHSGDRTLLAGGLRHAAAIYHERAVRAAEWYAEYTPLLLTVIVGGTLTIGFTLLVIWPYASTLNELARWNWK